MKNIYQAEDAPCLKCTRRFVGCHSQCATYMDYKQRREADRMERKKVQEIAEVQYFASMRRQSSRRKDR